jgi:alanyl-tRNA synthetase
MYNKWHVREVYCGECFECLNQNEVIEQTQLATQAAQENKLIEFWMGVYSPSKTERDKSSADDEE